MMSKEGSELKNILEAALLAAGEPLTLERMFALFPADVRPSRQAINDALKALASEYQGRGIELKQIDRSYRFQTRERYAPWLARLAQERAPRYSRALLETLAIIAYKQPVTRGDIEAIRGVAVSTDIVRTLLEREWVRQVGHRDVPGKPALYGTTRQFIEHFNLSSLDELPPLSELRDLAEIGRELNLPFPPKIPAGNRGERDSQTEEAAKAATEEMDEEPAEPADAADEPQTSPVSAPLASNVRGHE
jgi:segregation and condensation protein B